MQWDSYPAVHHRGQRYGLKGDSFGPFLALPERLGQVFELALGSASAPRALLRAHGWGLRACLEVTRDPWTYPDYIRHSEGECGVPKHASVVSRRGWLSERRAACLASGRPCLLQDTGFPAQLPTGAGLIPFRPPDEVASGLAEINGRYDHHCRAARVLAED